MEIEQHEVKKIIERLSSSSDVSILNEFYIPIFKANQ